MVSPEALANRLKRLRWRQNGASTNEQVSRSSAVSPIEIFTDAAAPERVEQFVRGISRRMIDILVSPSDAGQRNLLGLPLAERELRSSVKKIPNSKREQLYGWMSISDSSPRPNMLIEGEPVEYTSISVFIPPSLEGNMHKLFYKNPLTRGEKIDEVAQQIEEIRIEHITRDGVHKEIVTERLGRRNWHITISNGYDVMIEGTLPADPETSADLNNYTLTQMETTTNAIFDGFFSDRDQLSQTAA